MQTTTTVRFAGFGGQGIVRAGEIVAAAALAEGKQVLQAQSYGSSARGGLCTTDVTVGSGLIVDVEADTLDVLVALSQDSCNHFRPMLAPSGTFIYDSDLVTAPDRAGARGVRATHIASSDLGRAIVTNMVVLGFFGAATGLLRRETLEGAIRSHVPRGTDSLNLKAFSLGWDLALG